MIFTRIFDEKIRQKFLKFQDNIGFLQRNKNKELINIVYDNFNNMNI